MIKPTYDRIIVKAIKETQTASGIILPGTEEGPVIKGTVISVGSGRPIDGSIELAPLTVKESDIVLFPAESAIEFTNNGEDLLILAEYNVLIVLGEDS